MKNAFFFRPLAIPFADVDQACLVSDSRFLDSGSRREKRTVGKIFSLILEFVH